MNEIKDILKNQKVSPRTNEKLRKVQVDRKMPNGLKVGVGVVTLSALLALGKCTIDSAKATVAQMQDYDRFEYFWQVKLGKNLADSSQEELQQSWDAFMRDKDLQAVIAQEMNARRALRQRKADEEQEPIK
jgi:hypothetical protein